MYQKIKKHKNGGSKGQDPLSLRDYIFRLFGPILPANYHFHGILG